jgi:sialic acid synthase SpsE
MHIGSFDTSNRVLVVAEIGNNHEGHADVAEELVRQAAACGAGAVKFQVFRARHFVSRRDEARFARLSSFELPYETFASLATLARSLGLLFIATPLDLPSSRFLADHVDAMKIASGDNDFFPLLDEAARSAKPIIVSSGLSDLAQIARSTHYIVERWQRFGVPEAARQLAVLHCVSSYPTPPEDVHLSALGTLARALNCTIGYSDHTLGIDACLAAVAAGARIIEKHFTVDKHYSDFRDHQLSADPQDLRALVAGIARVAQLLGRPEKALQPSEAAHAQAIRRSIVAAADLPAGHRIESDDLMWIRPADGLRPGDEPRLIGHALKHPIALGEPIRLVDIE